MWHCHQKHTRISMRKGCGHSKSLSDLFLRSSMISLIMFYTQMVIRVSNTRSTAFPCSIAKCLVITHMLKRSCASQRFERRMAASSVRFRERPGVPVHRLALQPSHKNASAASHTFHVFRLITARRSDLCCTYGESRVFDMQPQRLFTVRLSAARPGLRRAPHIKFSPMRHPAFPSLIPFAALAPGPCTQ